MFLIPLWILPFPSNVKKNPRFREVVALFWGKLYVVLQGKTNLSWNKLCSPRAKWMHSDWWERSTFSLLHIKCSFPTFTGKWNFPPRLLFQTADCIKYTTIMSAAVLAIFNTSLNSCRSGLINKMLIWPQRTRQENRNHGEITSTRFYNFFYQNRHGLQLIFTFLFRWRLSSGRSNYYDSRGGRQESDMHT